MGNGTTDYLREIVNPGDRVSELAHDINVASYANSKALTVVPHAPGNFRGPVGYVWNRQVLAMMANNDLDSGGTYWTMLEEAEADGAGGKPQFFTLLGLPEVFWHLGREIIAMNVDDFGRTGRKPILMKNQPDIKRITSENFHLAEAMFHGYGQALAESNLVSITGETAVMKHSITAFCDTGSDDQLVLTWNGSCIGLCHRDLLFHPENIEPGMPIVGFRERGYRCNGGTFFTELILKTWGNTREAIVNDPAATTFVHGLTIPSISYAKTMSRIAGWNDDGTIREPLARICGAAHITGGGVWNKFGELLPDGIGARLDSMLEPPEVLLEGQIRSQATEKPMSDWAGYSTFHGGYGMMLVAKSNQDAEVIMSECIEDGIEAHVIGDTTDDPSGVIYINSRFMNSPDMLRSDQPF